MVHLSTDKRNGLLLTITSFHRVSVLYCTVSDAGFNIFDRDSRIMRGLLPGRVIVLDQCNFSLQSLILRTILPWRVSHQHKNCQEYKFHQLTFMLCSNPSRISLPNCKSFFRKIMYGSTRSVASFLFWAIHTKSPIGNERN